MSKRKGFNKPMLYSNNHYVFSEAHIKENLYISYGGLLIPKYAMWLRDYNKAISHMRAGKDYFTFRLQIIHKPGINQGGREMVG